MNDEDAQRTVMRKKHTTIYFMWLSQQLLIFAFSFPFPFPFWNSGISIILDTIETLLIAGITEFYDKSLNLTDSSQAIEYLIKFLIWQTVEIYCSVS